MRVAVTLLVIGSVAFGLGAVMTFEEARSNAAVIRDGLGVVTLVNAEWVALLLLSAMSGSTALILAYLSKAVEVLASASTPRDLAVDEA